MRYITRTLRFEDGEWDQSVIDEAGYGNWRVISVLDYHAVGSPTPSRVEYLRCLVEDRT